MCSQTPYVKFYGVHFGGQNVLAHLLIGNRRKMREYRKTSRALKRKEKIGLKLRLGKFFKLNFYGIFFFEIAFKS